MKCDAAGLAPGRGKPVVRPDRRNATRVGVSADSGASGMVSMPAKTVLIIDDDCSFVEALATFLEDNGYSPLRAFNGCDGRERLQSGKADLAIIDVHMPDVDGVELLLETGRLAKPIPVIMISSDDGVETVNRCRGSGAAMFMAKPIVPEELLAAIPRTMERQAS